MEGAAATERVAGKTQVDVGLDDRGDRRGGLETSNAIGGLWITRRSCPFWAIPGGHLGQSFCPIEERQELADVLAESNEKVRYVAALSDFLRQLGDAGLRNETGNLQRAGAAGLVPVEADDDLGNLLEGLGPVGAEDAGAAGRGHRRDAAALQDQPVELALADHDPAGLGLQALPAVELNGASRGGKHLRRRHRVGRVLGELEEANGPMAVKDRNGDPKSSPAEEMEVDDFITDPALVQVGTDARRERKVPLGGECRQVVEVGHGPQCRRASPTTKTEQAAGCGKMRSLRPGFGGDTIHR